METAKRWYMNYQPRWDIIGGIFFLIIFGNSFFFPQLFIVHMT